MLHIHELSKSYNNKKVLSNINHSFAEGNIYGIVGHNGSGKTTFFKCLLGIEKYNGTIEDKNYKPLKNHTGYLPTDLFFFSRISAQEYIQFMLSARQINLNTKTIDAANIFHLPLNEFCERYSTGMKKQLAFMAVMLQNNAYYILDEPFNGLDLRSNLVLKKTILKLKRDGKTIFLSSHILSTLTDICDEILLIQHGSLVSFLPPTFSHIEDHLL